jgi:hypothetical protein
MKIKVSFHKVIGLPSEPEPNAFYFVQDGDIAETYLTDADGVPKYVGSTPMVAAAVNAVLESSETTIDGGTI